MAEQDQTLSASEDHASGVDSLAAGAEHASAADRDHGRASEQDDNRVDAALLAEYAAEDRASEEDDADPYATAPYADDHGGDDLDERALYGEARTGEALYAYDPTDDAGLYDPFADDEDGGDPDEPAGLPARGPLSFDPFLQAGADGTGEGGLLPEAYTAPTRPDWLDALPKGERAKTESLFNGMAKLHRETAEYRAFQHAVRDPERSTDAIYAQIERAARGFGMSAEAYLELLHPDAGDGLDFSEDGGPYDPGLYDLGLYDSGLDDEDAYAGGFSDGDPYGGDPYAPSAPQGGTSPRGRGEDLRLHDLASEEGAGWDGADRDGADLNGADWNGAVVRAARELLAADPDFAAFKEEREVAHIQGAREEWRETQGAALAPRISERLRGFPVTPEMVQHAYEQAYLRYDDAAMADPELAVKTAFRGEWDAFRDAELAEAGSGRRRAPAMARAAGSSPANPEYGHTAQEAKRFLRDHPDY